MAYLGCFQPTVAKAAAAATPAPAKTARKKRRLSPEGRARIIAVTKNAVGGAEEGQNGGEGGDAEEGDAGGVCEGRGGQTGPEARCPEKRWQEIKAGDRVAEGGRGEGGAEATGTEKSARREDRGAAGAGSAGCGRAGRHGLAGGARNRSAGVGC